MMLNTSEAQKEIATQTEKTELIEASLFLDFKYDGRPIDIILPDGTQAKLFVANNQRVYFQVSNER